MNFIPATLADGGATVVASGFRLPVPEALRAAAAGRDGPKVVLGIRPENIREAAPRGAAAAPCPSPPRSSSSSRWATRSSSTAASATTCWWPRSIRTAPQDGRRRWTLVVEVDALHLFDAATEQRLRLA